MLSGYREQDHGKPIVGRGDAVIRTVVFCPRVSKFGDFAQGRTIPEHGFAGERTNRRNPGSAGSGIGGGQKPKFPKETGPTI